MEAAGRRKGELSGRQKMKLGIIAFAVASALVVLEASQSANAQGIPASMSAEQAREANAYAIGLQAYLWGFPLHYYGRTTPKTIETGGAYLNDFRKFSELKTAKDKF